MTTRPQIGNGASNMSRMTSVFSRLSDRERTLLIGAAFTLIGLTLLRFGIYSPLRDVGSLLTERSNFTLEFRSAEKAEARLPELAQRRDDLRATVAGYRRTAFIGLDSSKAAVRFLSELDNMARDAGAVVTSKSARSLPGADGWESIGAELVLTGKAKQVFGLLRDVGTTLPTASLESLNVTRSLTGPSLEARAFLVISRPSEVSRMKENLSPTGTAGKAENPSLSLKGSSQPSFSNLLSGRIFGEEPPPVPVKIAVHQPALPPPPVVEPVVEETPAPPMKSAYRLMGFSDDQRKPYAVLQETSSGKTVVAGVGDTVGGERILAISRRGLDMALPDGTRQFLPVP